MAAGKITGIEELITRRVAIEDVVEKGFLTLLNEKDTQGKQTLRYNIFIHSNTTIQSRFLFTRNN